MEREDIKSLVKAQMGGVMAINPVLYGTYLDWLAVEYSISRDEARDIAKESLSELPPIDWD